MKKKFGVILFVFSLFFQNAWTQTTNTDTIIEKKIITLDKRVAKIEKSLGVDKEEYKHNSAEPVLKDLYNTCKDCTEPNVLIYDFKCKHFFYLDEKTKTFKWLQNLNQVKAVYNKEFKIKVVNINRYIYDIDFSTDNIEFGSEQPALFKQFFLGDGSYLNDLVSKIAVNQQAATNAALIGEDDNESSNLVSAIFDFTNDYYELVDNQLKAYKYCPENFECCDKKRSSIKFSEFAIKLLNLKLAYQKYNEAFIKKIPVLQKEIDDLKKILDDCNKKKEELETSFKKETNEEKKKKILGEINALNTCKNETSTHKLKVEEKADKEILKSDIDKLWASISKVTDEDLMKLTLFNNNLVADHFSYTSPPIYPKGNKLSIGLKISPSDSSLIKKWNIMPLYNDSLGLDIFVKGKWFVSFSSGVFAGFRGKLQNETYAWQPQLDVNGVISDSSRYKLVSTGRGNAPIGFTAFANIGTKLSNVIGIGISPGVGITVEETPKPVYLLGGSLFFGEKNQFNITLGIAAAQVDKLKTELYSNIGSTLYAKKPDKIEYSKSLNTSFFLSISYTIFSFEKSKNLNSNSTK